MKTAQNLRRRGMKLNLKMLLVALTVVTLGSASSSLRADDHTTKADVKEAANDTARAAKKAGRKVKDEVCEMIDGKMKCVAKKIKHSAQNAGDKVEDALD
jgi:hypothetical protein